MWCWGRGLDSWKFNNKKKKQYIILQYFSSVNLIPTLKKNESRHVLTQVDVSDNNKYWLGRSEPWVSTTELQSKWIKPPGNFYVPVATRGALANKAFEDVWLKPLTYFYFHRGYKEQCFNYWNEIFINWE